MGTSILIKTPNRGLSNANFKKSESLMNAPRLRYRGFRINPYIDSGCEIKAAKRNLRVISTKIDQEERNHIGVKARDKNCYNAICI